MREEGGRRKEEGGKEERELRWQGVGQHGAHGQAEQGQAGAVG